MQSELLYSSYRPGQLATMGPITPGVSASATLDRHSLAQRTTSLRRMRHLLELEAKHLGERTHAASNVTATAADRARVLEINPAGIYAIIHHWYFFLAGLYEIFLRNCLF